MRRLTFLVIILAALYSGYWFVGARAVQGGAREGLAQLQSEGWDARYSNLNTIGFPSRFDTTISDLSLTSPDGQFEFQGPFLQVFALSYQPNRVIAAFPDTFTLLADGQAFAVESQGLRLSAGVRARADLALDAITVETGTAKIAGDLIGQIQLDAGLAALRRADEIPNGYDFYLGADMLRLPSQLIQQIDPGGTLSDTIGRITIDTSLILDKPLDRYAFDGARPEPRIQKLVINGIDLNWGDITLRTTGSLDIDHRGIPEGHLTTKTAQWRQIIALLANAGVIDPGVAPTITNIAATMVDSRGMLELPVTFRNGLMSLGPIPLGPAPRLY